MDKSSRAGRAAGLGSSRRAAGGQQEELGRAAGELEQQGWRRLDGRAVLAAPKENSFGPSKRKYMLHASIQAKINSRLQRTLAQA